MAPRTRPLARKCIEARLRSVINDLARSEDNKHPKFALRTFRNPVQNFIWLPVRDKSSDTEKGFFPDWLEKSDDKPNKSDAESTRPRLARLAEWVAKVFNCYLDSLYPSPAGAGKDGLLQKLKDKWRSGRILYRRVLIPRPEDVAEVWHEWLWERWQLRKVAETWTNELAEAELPDAEKRKSLLRLLASGAPPFLVNETIRRSVFKAKGFSKCTKVLSDLGLLRDKHWVSLEDQIRDALLPKPVNEKTEEWTIRLWPEFRHLKIALPRERADAHLEHLTSCSTELEGVRRFFDHFDYGPLTFMGSRDDDVRAGRPRHTVEFPSDQDVQEFVFLDRPLANGQGAQPGNQELSDATLKGFAEQVADHDDLTGWIGLAGVRGAGKSSILNAIEWHARNWDEKMKRGRPLLVRFDLGRGFDPKGFTVDLIRELALEAELLAHAPPYVEALRPEGGEAFAKCFHMLKSLYQRFRGAFGRVGEWCDSNRTWALVLAFAGLLTDWVQKASADPPHASQRFAVEQPGVGLDLFSRRPAVPSDTEDRSFLVFPLQEGTNQPALEIWHAADPNGEGLLKPEGVVGPLRTLKQVVLPSSPITQALFCLGLGVFVIGAARRWMAEECRTDATCLPRAMLRRVAFVWLLGACAMLLLKTLWQPYPLDWWESLGFIPPPASLQPKELRIHADAGEQGESRRGLLRGWEGSFTNLSGTLTVSDDDAVRFSGLTGGFTATEEGARINDFTGLMMRLSATRLELDTPATNGWSLEVTHTIGGSNTVVTYTNSTAGRLVLTNVISLHTSDPGFAVLLGKLSGSFSNASGTLVTGKGLQLGSSRSEPLSAAYVHGLDARFELVDALLRPRDGFVVFRHPALLGTLLALVVGLLVLAQALQPAWRAVMHQARQLLVSLRARDRAEGGPDLDGLGAFAGLARLVLPQSSDAPDLLQRDAAFLEQTLKEFALDCARVFRRVVILIDDVDVLPSSQFHELVRILRPLTKIPGVRGVVCVPLYFHEEYRHPWLDDLRSTFRDIRLVGNPKIFKSRYQDDGASNGDDAVLVLTADAMPKRDDDWNNPLIEELCRLLSARLPFQPAPVLIDVERPFAQAVLEAVKLWRLSDREIWQRAVLILQRFGPSRRELLREAALRLKVGGRGGAFREQDPLRCAQRSMRIERLKSDCYLQEVSLDANIKDRSDLLERLHASFQFRNSPIRGQIISLNGTTATINLGWHDRAGEGDNVLILLPDDKYLVGRISRAKESASEVVLPTGNTPLQVGTECYLPDSRLSELVAMLLKVETTQPTQLPRKLSDLFGPETP